MNKNKPSVAERISSLEILGITEPPDQKTNKKKAVQPDRKAEKRDISISDISKIDTPQGSGQKKKGKEQRKGIIFEDVALELSTKETKVGLFLKRFVLPNTSEIRAGLTAIMKATGLSKNTIRTALLELEQKGLIETLEKGGAIENRKGSLYKIHFY